MYNEFILNRLTNLKFLGQIKKPTLSIISKDNEFGDVVKFFISVNKDMVIQNISFKASGCSAFLVMCDCFCELALNKKIDELSSIDVSKLQTFTILDEQKEHVYPIIISTIDMLTKKFFKALNSGKLVLSDIENINLGTKKISNNLKEKPIEDDLKDIIIDSKTKNNNKIVEEEKMENENLIKNNEVNDKKKKLTNRTKNASVNKLNKLISKQETNLDKKDLKAEQSEKTETLLNLCNKISTQTNNEEVEKQNQVNESAKALGNLLTSLNKITPEVKNESNNEIENNTIENSKIIDDSKLDNAEKLDNIESIENDKPKKEKKKSLFSWFKRK